MNYVRAVLFYDAEWNGNEYIGGEPGAEVFDINITLQQLIDRICSKKGRQREKDRVQLYFLWRNQDGRNIRMPINDDGDLKFASGENPLVIYVESDGRPKATPAAVMQIQHCQSQQVQRQQHATFCEPSGQENDAFQDSNLFPTNNVDFDDPDLHDLLNGNLRGDLNAFRDFITTDELDEISEERHRLEDSVDDMNEGGDRMNEECDDDYLSDWEKEYDIGTTQQSKETEAPSVYYLPGLPKHKWPEAQVHCLSDSQNRNSLREGAIFNSKDVMKLAICKYALEKKLSICFPNSNSIRFEVACTTKGCKFAFRARRGVKGFPIWNVTKFNMECKCLHDPDRAEHRQASARVIGNMFASRLGECQFTPGNIRSEIRDRYAVVLWYNKAWRALQIARDIAYGTHEQSWNFLPSWLNGLRETNPGTVIAIKTSTSGHFMYSFMALGPCIEGFKFIRPVVAMDATHLKGQLRGEIFVATGLDGSNCIYPIAFGFAPSEDENAWFWFVSKLRVAIGNRDDLVLVTDRGTSIPNVVREVYPNVPHVSCYYHLKQNLLKYCRKKKDVQEAFYEAAYTHSRERCDHLLQGIATACPKMHQDLIKLGVMKWAKSYCPKRRYNVMTTNSAESLNKVILPARRLPVTAAHEYIRLMCQNWFSSRHEAANKLKTSITAAASAKINDMNDVVDKCNVYPIRESSKYQVKHAELGEGIVNVEERTCTCGRWDSDQFPCFHAVAYARVARVRVSELCHKYYSKAFLQGAYGTPINPAPGPETWSPSNMTILPMVEKRQSGRPKEKRFRPPAEDTRKKKCGRCQGLGHTRRTCTNPASSSNGSTSGVGNGERSEGMSRRVMHCRRCGGAGHNIKTCSVSVPASVDETHADMSSHIDPTESETLDSPEPNVPPVH